MYSDLYLEQLKKMLDNDLVTYNYIKNVLTNNKFKEYYGFIIGLDKYKDNNKVFFMDVLLGGFKEILNYKNNTVFTNEYIEKIKTYKQFEPTDWYDLNEIINGTYGMRYYKFINGNIIPITKKEVQTEVQFIIKTINILIDLINNK